MPITVVNGPVIAEGETLSSGIDLSAGRIVRITTPADWTPASLSFQVSSDGTDYNDLFDANGWEIVIPCGPSRSIVVTNPAFAEGIAFVKFRSGTSALPVVQAERREFAVAIKTL